jgi:hypothetical protein
MVTAFCCRKREIVVEFMQQETTITSQVFCETKKLRRTVENKMCRTLSSSVLVLLLHDNARAHTPTRTRTLLEHFNWELFDHPPYSPAATTCLPT